MKKEKNLVVVLLALMAFTFTSVGYGNVVMAQEADEEVEDFEEEDAGENNENGDDSMELSEEEEDALSDDEEEDDGDLNLGEETGSSLYENEEGLEDEDGLYKLDNITAETFQRISNIERENALIKLRIEQGKLKLDLKKQAAEKKKLAASIIEEERQRTFKREEQERKIRQERLKDEQEQEKLRQENEKKIKEEEAARKKAEQEAAISQELVEKIKSADLTNPDDIVALTQLMSIATGKQADLSGLGRGASKETSRASKLWGEEEKKELPFEQKYEVKAIMGVGNNLVATIKYTEYEKTRTFKVKVGSYIEDWSVSDIKGSSVLLKRGSEIKVLNLN